MLSGASANAGPTLSLKEPSDLEVCFAANRPALARFLAARRQGFGDAEDILQDLWIKVSALEIRPLAEPLSYLFRMAENIVIDRSRSAMARQLREAEWAAGQIDGSFEEAIDAQPSAERILIARDHLRRVDAALDALPPKVAAAFRAVRLDGIPQKQVAASLGLSLSSVEKHLVTAFNAVLAVRAEPITGCDDLPRFKEEGGDHAEH